MAVANSFVSNRIATEQAEQAEQPAHLHSIEDSPARPEVRGKFIFIGERKYWIKGVTYGTFAPDAEGLQFPAPEVVEGDLAAMSANGLNTLRTYTVPPRWLLDAALRHGLRVMVGLPWEQHVAFLDDIATTSRIEISVRDAVRQCAGHPAVLCYALGNEIPASIVRWHGRRAIEAFLKRLYRIGKAHDPDGLFTYVNFPTTEYLQLPFLDLVCFNVYLETREKLSGYLARLQNIAGEKPLLMAEIGLDSRRNGEDTQAESLAWQVQTALTSGCIGAFAFAWTDEWYRGGHDIDDWDFGLTSRDRSPKPALDAVRDAFAAAPFPPGTDWPKISVIVCSYNGSATIRDTMEGFLTLEYPNFEVIVVNDGSTDSVPDIVGEYLGRYDLRLISTENRGLSNARNTGWQEASGEIIAYIDDDAYPDPHWLQYLAHTFMTTDYVGVGGPNIAPPGDGPIADCVANSPGGPVQVLISDVEAEHIPGCNMSFRREALAEIDGFDARYRAAGDDVDLCWRLQAAGGKIGFNAAAVDWHHRRNSILMYWKQQQGYGKAEALLEEKWPEKYNALGHFSWSGRLYGKGMTESIPTRRNHVYQGQWGLALFQSIYEPAAGFFTSLPLMPEWFLLIGVLAILSLLGLSWSPLLWATPLLVIAIAAPIAQAILSAAKADFPSPHPSAIERFNLRAITAGLHLMQPVARLKGRLEHGLTLWRERTTAIPRWLYAEKQALWAEQWLAPDAALRDIATLAREQHKVVLEGGDFDDWDIELNGGPGSARLVMAVEEHGAGRQNLCFRYWLRLPTIVVGTLFAGAGLATLAAMQGAWVAAAAIGLGVVVAAFFSLRQSAKGIAVFSDVLTKYQAKLSATNVDNAQVKAVE